VEIDGLGDPKSVVGGSNNGGSARETTNPVIVIATTTNLACLDKALTRPGRLEEHIALKLPDHEKRFHLAMQLLLKFDMSRFQGPTSQEEILRIAHKVAERTSGHSFAQVVSLVQMAAQTALACYLKGEEEKCTLEDLFRTFFSKRARN
jgi:SpoVK/Ycf46/Vps4 family AAA+-type ATPase